MKKISVIMGLYNCSETMSDAINSIINQSYTEWELILCDDGSSDSTYDIATKFAVEYPGKIILLKHEKNEHLSATLNDCLEHASGYYVARMDADDVSTVDRFKKQVDFLEQHDDFQLVGTSMQLFDDTGDLNIISNQDYPDKYSLKYKTPFFHPTIMTYKYVYDELGGYTVSSRTVRGQDVDLWFRFYALGFKGANLQEPLYRFRSDEKAYKRRTASARFNSARTMYYGYHLLKYPLHWYLIPLKEILKIFVPYKLVAYVRKKQGTKGKR